MKLPYNKRKECADLYTKGKTNSFLVKHFGISSSTVYNILDEFGVKRRQLGFDRRTNYFNEWFFEKINSSEKAYWLGFISADGSIDKKRLTLRIGLSSKDKDILYQFCKDICFNPDGLKFRIVNKKYPSVYISLNSRKIVKDLEKYGITNNKSLSLSPKNIPTKFKFDFLRGYFDGDGCVYKNSNRVEILGSKSTMVLFKKWLKQEGILGKVKKNNYCEIYHYNFWGLKNCLKFESILYSDGNFSMKRKRDIFASKPRRTALDKKNDETSQVLELKRKGLSYSEISKKTGLKYNRVHYLIKEFNKK
jgi:hypothetical protein